MEASGKSGEGDGSRPENRTGQSGGKKNKRGKERTLKKERGHQGGMETEVKVNIGRGSEEKEAKRGKWRLTGRRLVDATGR